MSTCYAESVLVITYSRGRNGSQWQDGRSSWGGGGGGGILYVQMAAWLDGGCNGGSTAVLLALCNHLSCRMPYGGWHPQLWWVLISGRV
jgi:hypothetical protein